MSKEHKQQTPNSSVDVKFSDEATSSSQSTEVVNDNRCDTRRKWPRCLLISVGILLLALMLCVAALIIWLGPIAERVIERYDKELVGRHLQMDNLRIKLFKGEVSADSLRLYESNDSTLFARINRLETTIAPRELFDRHVDVKRIAIKEPAAEIIQSDTTFNFDDMIQYITKTYLSEEDSTTVNNKPWRVNIENVRLDGGYVAYTDMKLDQQWIIGDLSVASDSILLKNATTRINASMSVNNQAQLLGDVALNLESLDFEFEGSLNKFELNYIYKYVEPVVNLREIRGRLNTELKLKGNANNITATDISGLISLDSLHLTGYDGGKLFAANTLSADVEEINIDKQRYILSSLSATNYSTQFIMRGDGTTNFDGLFYEEPELSLETTSQKVGTHLYDQKERVTISTSESVAPFRGMTLRIGYIQLSGGQMYFADKKMHKEFSYTLRNISIESRNFDIAAHNKLTIRANTNNQGTALVRWEGSLNDFYNQSILASLSNIKMKDFTPYLEHFTAFPITSGNLTFRSQNVVTNGELSGINRLGTYDFGVGKRDKSLDPEFNIPLKLGVYVLTDKDKHIDIDLPISGRIDSPEFSYRKVIFKAIGNLLLKIVASPFSWMSPEKRDVFRHIDYELLDPSISSEQYARLDNIAAALKEDNSLKVRLKQSINYEQATRDIADLNLKMAYYNSTQVEADKRLDMLDFVRISQMRLANKDVAKFADSLLVARGIDPTHLTTHAKAKALYGDMVDKQLSMLSEGRNKIIRDYISFQHKELAAESFSIETMTIDEMKKYTGKPRFNITLIVDDEEISISSDEESSEAELSENNKAEHEASTEGNINTEEKSEQIE